MVRDAAAGAGLVLLFAGCWLWSPPLGLVVVGLILLGSAVWGHWRDSR